MHLVLQVLVDLKAEPVINACRYERTDERTSDRNVPRSAKRTSEDMSRSTATRPSHGSLGALVRWVYAPSLSLPSRLLSCSTGDTAAMDVAGFVFIVLVFGVICSFVGRWVAGDKGRRSAGTLLGFFFGPIGIVIAGLLARTPEAEAAFQARVASAGQQGLGSCSWCSEPIQRTALVCRWCGREAPQDDVAEFQTEADLWDYLYERVAVEQDLDSLERLLDEAGVAPPQLSPAAVHALAHSAWAAGDTRDERRMVRQLAALADDRIN